MKKGFTLIEMIGVMVILSLLLLFVMPSVINYIKKGGDTKDTVVKTMIFEATKKYIDDNKNVFKKDVKNTYCISLYTLANEGYVESPITLSSSDQDITSEESTKTVKITYDKKYKYELVDECTGIVNPIPILYPGLTPVVYVDQSTEENPTAGYWKVPDKNEEWYDYDHQKWANAVVLGTDNEGHKIVKNPGDRVEIDGTEAKMMLVWIPRFEYKYTNLGNQYAGGTADQPGGIDINFVLKNTTKASSDEYKIHPAFTFGTEEVSGFWVGKFELSSINQNSVNNVVSKVSNLRILPNVASLINNDVSNFFYAIRSIENTQSFGLNNMDTHMMKNSEWGAVAYLSQSKYGKYGNNDYDKQYKEVYQNKSDNYITGSSNGTPSQDGSRDGGQCAYNNMLDLGTDEDNSKKGQCGPGASTTGNIYGVYDMSGGAYEYVMGAYGPEYPTIGSHSGFTPSDVFTSGTINPKYYDVYKNETNSSTNDATRSCDEGVCYGHALSETSGWYGDYKYMVTSSVPWIVRGGIYYYKTSAGVFCHYYFSGNSNLYSSARVVGFGK